MPAEDVVTDIPSLAAPAMPPEPGTSANVPTRMPLLAFPTEEAEDDHPSSRGVFVLDPTREVLFSVALEFRLSDLPRWEPSMDFDQPRILTDDE